MLAIILKHGASAGLIAGVGLSLAIAYGGDAISYGPAGLWVSYAVMLAAMSLVFVAIKQQRAVTGSGVIGFWPAFGMGLAISVVAGVLYVAVWELAQVTIVHSDFAQGYAEAMVARKRAEGANAVELTQATRAAADFIRQYHNPLIRLPMTFMEIFPVGVLVSLISAALFRNPRFMPATR